MKATIQLQPQDLVDAMRLHLRPRPVMRVLLFVLIPLFGVAVVILVSGALADGHWNGIHLTALFAISFFAARYFFTLPWRARQSFYQQKSMQAPISIETADEVFVIESSHGNVRMPWGDYHKWKANNKLILLYHSQNLYNMVPRRACPTDAEWESLLTFIKTKMGPQRP